MTRINVGIEPQHLHPKHLLAEAREMKRIPNAVRTGRAKIENSTDKFTLGRGHVTFFYKRLGYLLTRYKKIYAECIRRGYNVTDFSSAWEGVPAELMGGYAPTKQDRKIVLARIKERLSKMDKPK